MPSQWLHQLLLQEGLSASPTPRPRTHCGGVHQQIGNSARPCLRRWCCSPSVGLCLKPLVSGSLHTMPASPQPFLGSRRGLVLSSFPRVLPFTPGCKLCLPVTPSPSLKHSAQLRLAPDSPLSRGRVTGPPLVRESKSDSPTLRAAAAEQHLELTGCLNRLVMQRSPAGKLRRKAHDCCR